MAQIKKQNLRYVPAPFAVPAPKKPRKPEDHFVLEKFKELKNLDDDEPVDLGALVENDLREVLRLVTGDKSHDEGMDLSEVMGAAGNLLAQEGNSLRFKKSVVQIEARSCWKTMEEAARAPYDAKVRAARRANRPPHARTAARARHTQITRPG